MGFYESWDIYVYIYGICIRHFSETTGHAHPHTHKTDVTLCKRSWRRFDDSLSSWRRSWVRDAGCRKRTTVTTQDMRIHSHIKHRQQSHTDKSNTHTQSHTYTVTHKNQGICTSVCVCVTVYVCKTQTTLTYTCANTHIHSHTHTYTHTHTHTLVQIPWFF